MIGERCGRCGDPMRESADGSGRLRHVLAGPYGVAEVPYDHVPTRAPAATEPPAAVINFRSFVVGALRASNGQVGERRITRAETVEMLVTEFDRVLRGVRSVEIDGARAAVQWVDYDAARVGLDSSGRFVRVEIDEPTIVEMWPDAPE